MKTMILNAGPRKTWNTAQLLREAQKGAEAVGAETEYIELYDLSYTGCRSCLACKGKGAERCKCYWKDDLSPVIERIFRADAVIIGSPIYLGEPTAQFRALFERLIFCALSYDGGPSYFQGKVNVGLIYTMNCPRETYDSVYTPAFRSFERTFPAFLHGDLRTYAACGTLQVDDYGRFSMGRFNEAERRAHRETQFPVDREECRRLGAALSTAQKDG